MMKAESRINKDMKCRPALYLTRRSAISYATKGLKRAMMATLADRVSGFMQQVANEVMHELGEDASLDCELGGGHGQECGQSEHRAFGMHDRRDLVELRIPHHITSKFSLMQWTTYIYRKSSRGPFKIQGGPSQSSVVPGDIG